MRRFSLWPCAAIAALITATLIPLAACSAPHIQPADNAPLIPESAWPPPGKVMAIDAPFGLIAERIGFMARANKAESDLAASIVGPDNLPRIRWEDEGGFVFHPKQSGRATPGVLYFEYVSADTRSPAKIPMERTWFSFTRPQGPMRGIALLMPGLQGTPPGTVDMIAARLRTAGWGVLRMLSQPSRFTEKATFAIDTDHPDPGLSRAADVIDRRAGQCAQSVRAAFEFLDSREPGLARAPRIVIGLSGGAMTLPTVVARDPDPYTAAVLIGGGCNFFAITRQSNYEYIVDAVHFRWSPKDPTPDQLAAMDKAYLAHATLDSFHAAAALKGKPILMLQADHDGAVPAHLGDLLWERLGKPERWVQQAGHEELFMSLPKQMDRILAWINADTPPPAPGK